MLEMMYGAGLRVSEAIDLKSSQLIFDIDVVRVFGKGSKERFVIFGKKVRSTLDNYIKLTPFVIILHAFFRQFLCLF